MDSSSNGEGTVRAEYLHKNWVSGLNRSVEVNNVTVKHIEYIGEAVKWVSFDCDEGILYIVSNGFENVAIFLSEAELEKEEVIKVDFSTKELKQIKFINKDYEIIEED